MIKSPGTGKKTGRRQQNPPRSSRNQTRRRKSRPDGEEKNQRLRRRPRLRDFQRQKSQKRRLRKRRRSFPPPRDRRNRQKSLEITAAAAGGRQKDVVVGERYEQRRTALGGQHLLAVVDIDRHSTRRRELRLRIEKQPHQNERYGQKGYDRDYNR